ncbi:hypothetical protein Zmor_020416 [Zophobas morio]|uniref:Uncharacterized protein n=1 Tax=Zophobas morio TaxID=2755281 RepID=A0AA38MA18_9CUCU|nr:hypothetical protein Zmor_020416 [Zophobas morio]
MSLGCGTVSTSPLGSCRDKRRFLPAPAWTCRSTALQHCRVLLVDGSRRFCVSGRRRRGIVLDNFTVTLVWDSSSSLTYQFYFLSNASTDFLKPTSQITHSGQIILILDLPLFVEQLFYTISGSIAFRLNDKKINLKFPAHIQLRPQDVTDNVVVVHLYKVIDGTINDIHALAFSSQKQEFVVVIQERLGRSLEDIFEAECALRQINLETPKKYFLVYKISPVLDGVLIEVEESLGREMVLNTYCKNSEVTVALLHYLHTHIIGAVIIPKSPYQPDLGLEELTQLARDSLSNEIEKLKEYRSDLRQLRKQIASSEHQTDLLMVCINEKLSS